MIYNEYIFAGLFSLLSFALFIFVNEKKYLINRNLKISDSSKYVTILAEVCFKFHKKPLAFGGAMPPEPPVIYKGGSAPPHPPV